MRYNALRSYNQAGISYTGTVVIKIQGIQNPVILNNISVILAKQYLASSTLTTIGIVSVKTALDGVVTMEVLNPTDATLTTIGVISVQVGLNGLVTIETLNDTAAALIGAQSITIHSDTLVSVG